MTAWSIVIPTYREARNLEGLIPAIAQAAASARAELEIVVVDDDSRDGTEAVVAGLIQAGHPVVLVVRKGVRGLSSAVLAGFRQARHEVLFCMDADFSHPPESLPRLAEALAQPDCDMVFGSRYLAGGTTQAGWGLLRWLNSRVATLLARPFAAISDPMSGFFALRRETFLAAAGLNPVGYKIGLELLVKCRCQRVREVPIHFANRKFGQSKLTLREQVNYLVHLKRLADFKWGWISQLLQFSVIGAMGMAIDLSLYALFLAMGWPVAGARGLAIAAAMTFNFMLNRNITFSAARDDAMGQYLRYVLGCAAGALVSWLLSVGLATRGGPLGSHHLLAAILGIGAGTGLNFALSRQWAFRLAGAIPAGPGRRWWLPWRSR